MRQIMGLVAVGVAATTLMLATPGTSEARGGHSHGGGHHHGGHHHGSYHRYHRGGYYYGGWGYYRNGRHRGTRYYYRNTYCVPPNNCGWTGYQTDQWFPHDTDPAYFGYYVNGVQVAGYNQNTGVYRTYDAATDTWSGPVVPPWAQANSGL